ncbi:uncharacterized protein AB675_5762 [Cyphellophora attinorum]|uniref:Uncharacterized protein n=1 Tax=Cyphellophora attinorum TaxID=1664694 RepID=A0A0N1NZL4_9EURO|nr:uncharacterized protein AB675_5762 [Phialophora attinorum]KPI38812.1 hypothetical protein AB675_5762 [Phialophora attinorum]
MVLSRAAGTASKLHESISAFVPFFLSHRAESRVSAAETAHNVFDHVEYTGSATSTGGNRREPALPTVEARATANMPPPTISRSQTYNSSTSSSTSQSSRKQRPRYYKTRPVHHSRKTSSSTAHTRSQTHSHSSRSRPRRKVTAFTRLRLATESKFRLTISFGLAFLTALILYLGLFLSHTSNGATFHVLSILLLISFLAIFLHSLLRFLNLNSELKAMRAHRAGLKKTPSARGWNISRPLPQWGGNDVVDDEKGQHHDDDIGEGNGGYEHDGFPIFNGTTAAHHYDQDSYDHDIEADAANANHPDVIGLQGRHVVYPPPVYGNTRTSVRLSLSRSQPNSPNLSIPNGQAGHPSITAPTNATLAPGMPGWHPPSFRSEGGITAVLERRRAEVQERLGGGKSAAKGRAPGEEGVLLGNARYEPGVERAGGGMI